MNPGEGLPYLRPDVICTKKKKGGMYKKWVEPSFPPWLPLHLVCNPLFNSRLSPPAIQPPPRTDNHHAAYEIQGLQLLLEVCNARSSLPKSRYAS